MPGTTREIGAQRGGQAVRADPRTERGGRSALANGSASGSRRLAWRGCGYTAFATTAAIAKGHPQPLAARRTRCCVALPAALLCRVWRERDAQSSTVPVSTLTASDNAAGTSHTFAVTLPSGVPSPPLGAAFEPQWRTTCPSGPRQMPRAAVIALLAAVRRHPHQQRLLRRPPARVRAPVPRRGSSGECRPAHRRRVGVCPSAPVLVLTAPCTAHSHRARLPTRVHRRTIDKIDKMETGPLLRWMRFINVLNGLGMILMAIGTLMSGLIELDISTFMLSAYIR